MIRFTVSVEVERSVEDVFEYLSDPAKLPEWQTNTAEVEQLTDGPLAVGSRLREVHVAFGRRVEQVVEVVEHDPPRRFALRVASGPLPINASWDLESVDRGTRLTMRGEGRLGRALEALRPLVARAARRQMLAHHRRLKRTLEGRASATAPSPTKHRDAGRN